MIGVYMCNLSKGLKSFSCLTQGTDKNFDTWNTYVGLLLLLILVWPP